jgi:predicted dehydrogenase
MTHDQFQQHELTRRRFLERSVAAGMAGLGAATTSAATTSPSKHGEKLRVGVIGLRRRGLDLAQAFAREPGVEVAALCDLDSLVRRTALRDLASVQPRVPKVVTDYCRLIDDESLHAIVVATPDHWHAPMAIAACDAGKDVYLEAPVTHTLAEAERLQSAAAASGRIVQCGLQQRSGEHFCSAIELIRAGGIGRIGFARAWAVHRRVAPTVADAGGLSRTRQSGSSSHGGLPHDVDYSAWLGPAPAIAFDPLRFHHHWRWFWDYGSGELGNWGVHLLDVARWGLGVELPTRVTAQGRNVLTDGRLETPDTLNVQYEYPGCVIVWEHRLWSDYGMEGRSAGVAFYGDEGTLVVDRGGWKVYGRRDGASSPRAALRWRTLLWVARAVRCVTWGMRRIGRL